eukprot:COSAG02_NODE_241_length_27638_cov_13.101020_1_plen_62_part_00
MVGSAARELALVAQDPCSWWACGGGADMRGQLRQWVGHGLNRDLNRGPTKRGWTLSVRQKG